MLRTAAIGIALVAAPVAAQMMRDSIKPAIGSPAVATLGDSVYEKSHLSVLRAYTVDEAFTRRLSHCREDYGMTFAI